ncbi:MAG: SusD/RagB family nutrient-binding outer membrane lipoprotein [Bacteroidota bacterium]
MKNYFKYIFSIAFVCLLSVSCDQTDLDLQVSPNDLAADASDPNLLLNAIQLAYAGNQQELSDIAAELTRIDYFFGRDYFNNLPGSTLDDVWRRTYSSGLTVIGDSDLNTVSVGILTNLQTLEELNTTGTTDLSFHVGVAKTLYAHSLMQLVDFVGEAAFSQAGQSADFPAPTLDGGQTVYDAAFMLLDEAEALLNGDPPTVGVQDLYYNGSASNWVRLINSLRLRSYALTGNKAAFDAIINGDNYISSSDHDFQLQYGTSELQPDNRHPDYIDDYKPDGADIYQSNWLMETMFEYDDPRRRYYFYRQVTGTPGGIDVDGNEVEEDEEQLACSLVIPPPHYDGFVFCSASAGYWGRSHGNDEGTPPDGFQRTASGVYPAGGRFDDNSFNVVGLGLGGGGAGIEPIILSSYVDFWQGIMADDKASFLQSGLEKSIAKVQTFAALDVDADMSVAPSDADVEAYITAIVDRYNAATGDEKENIFAEQYFITLFGGATESYNYYRLTGYPTTVYPSWEPDPGPFPRTLLTPQSEVINNPNVTQKSDLTTQVFWDSNPASPAFPPAN